MCVEGWLRCGDDAVSRCQLLRRSLCVRQPPRSHRTRTMCTTGPTHTTGWVMPHFTMPHRRRALHHCARQPLLPARSSCTPVTRRRQCRPPRMVAGPADLHSEVRRRSGSTHLDPFVKRATSLPPLPGCPPHRTPLLPVPGSPHHPPRRPCAGWSVLGSVSSHDQRRHRCDASTATRPGRRCRPGQGGSYLLGVPPGTQAPKPWGLGAWVTSPSQSPPLDSI